MTKTFIKLLQLAWYIAEDIAEMELVEVRNSIEEENSHSLFIPLAEGKIKHVRLLSESQKNKIDKLAWNQELTFVDEMQNTYGTEEQILKDWKRLNDTMPKLKKLALIDPVKLPYRKKLYKIQSQIFSIIQFNYWVQVCLMESEKDLLRKIEEIDNDDDGVAVDGFEIEYDITEEQFEKLQECTEQLTMRIKEFRESRLHRFDKDDDYDDDGCYDNDALLKD